MKYDMTKPCDQCPFLEAHKAAFSKRRLDELSSGEFPCHLTAALLSDDDSSGSKFVEGPDSRHCAGALIYLEKRNRSHPMLRIQERLGAYDRARLDTASPVR